MEEEEIERQSIKIIKEYEEAEILKEKCINCGKRVEKDSNFTNVCKQCDNEGFE